MRHIDMDAEFIENREEGVEYGVTTPNKFLVYQLYFLDKKSVSEISYHVSIGRRQIQNIIRKLKNEIDGLELTKLQRKVMIAHFRDLKSLEEISKIYRAHLGNIYDIIGTYVREISTKMN
jgi:predicted DNA-binding protein YlxM (UPF0122 family)